MSKIAKNKFLELSLEQIPRLLGQLNRNPSSKSYGSFDRAYWHYRTNDISCARYQEAVYTLSLLYCSDFEGNDFYHDPKLLEWIRASLRFTVEIQRGNGSFDEWYINEGSYVATAFLISALSQTILLFREHNIKIEEEKAILRVLESGSQFLINAKEDTVMNQVSGAIFAISAVGKILDNREFTDTAEDLCSIFISKQNKEGWWSEYGGPDIGYLTLTISYLGKYKKLTGSTKGDSAISSAKSFVHSFINPDHSAGGEYMSRNTEYIIPSESLPYIGAVKPSDFDDRYLCYILYNWIETGLKLGHIDFKPSFGEQYFSESGLVRVFNNSYFLVANGKKGGSLRIYSEGKVYFDSGLEVASAFGNLSAGILDDANEVTFENGKLKVSGSVKKIKEPLMPTSIAIVFKTWQWVFGQISFFQKIIKDFLRPRMVSYSKATSVIFERQIEYTPTSIAITDAVRGALSRNAILLGLKSAYSAVPSSKYGALAQTENHLLKPVWDEKQDGETYIIKRTFNFNA